MKPTAEEKIIQGLEEFADALESGADITTKFTCRKVTLNLEPTPYSPELIKETRKELGVSQVLFAQFLGVSTGAVQRWEHGEVKPQGIACRFMDEIRQDPPYWRSRLLEAFQRKTATV